jgi:hypothetical protein
MPLDAAAADILLRKDEENLARKVQQGRRLTAAERARLEQLRSGQSSAPPAPEYVTRQADLARLLGVSRQRLQYHLRQRGFPKRDAAGRWPVAGALAYARAAGLTPDRPGAPAADAETDGTTLYAERLRKTREEADKLALENARMRGELVETESVYRHFEAVFVALRQKILACGLLDEEKDELLNELLRLTQKTKFKPSEKK